MSTYLTLGEASREVTVTKSTIHRAISDGRLSATKDDHNQYKIDPAELFRVFDPIPRTEEAEKGAATQSGESNATPQTENSNGDQDVWFQKLIDDLRSEKDQLLADNKEKDEKLAEIREAMRALPNPETVKAERERLVHENSERLRAQANAHKDALETEQKGKAKAIAQEKQRSTQWKEELVSRQTEIKHAREEANRISEQAAADIAKIERRAASERAIREALESRGFIARMLNKKPTTVG